MDYNSDEMKTVSMLLDISRNERKAPIVLDSTKYALKLANFF